MDPKQAIFVGLGWIEKSQERIEELVEELVERGQLTRKEAARFIKQVAAQARGEKEEFRKVVHEMLRDAFTSAGVATRDDLAGLESRLENIEKKIRGLKGEKAKEPKASGKTKNSPEK